MQATSLRLMRQFLPEVGAHQLAVGKTIQVELFVGRMGVVIRQGQSEQQGIRVEMFFEIVHDGNGTALANEHRLLSEGGFQGAQGAVAILLVRGT